MIDYQEHIIHEYHVGKLINSKELAVQLFQFIVH